MHLHLSAICCIIEVQQIVKGGLVYGEQSEFDVTY